MIQILLLYMIEENYYLLVINGSNIKKDLAWLDTHNSFSCIIDNQSDNYSLFAIQGPTAIKLLQQLTDMNLSAIK